MLNNIGLVDLLESLKIINKIMYSLNLNKISLKFLKSCISKQDKSIEFNDEIIKCIFAMNEYNRESIDDLAKYLINSLKFHGYLIDQFKFDKFHEFMKSLIDKYKGLKFKSSSNQHIVLIPSSKCLFFPWESLNF